MVFVADTVSQLYCLIDVHHSRVELKDEVLVVQFVIGRKESFGLAALFCHILIKVDACLFLAVNLRYVVHDAVHTLYKIIGGVSHCRRYGGKKKQKNDYVTLHIRYL